MSELFISQSLLNFPQKLYIILENNQDNHNFISWNKNGTSFQIRNNIQFENVIIPKYFKRKLEFCCCCIYW